MAKQPFGEEGVLVPYMMFWVGALLGENQEGKAGQKYFIP